MHSYTHNKSAFANFSEAGIVEVDPLVHLGVVAEGAVVVAVVSYQSRQLILVDAGPI